MLMAHATTMTANMVGLMMLILLPMMLLVVLVLGFVTYIHRHVILLAPIHHHLVRLLMSLPVHAI